jgi:type IV pilus assembly protein PilP
MTSKARKTGWNWSLALSLAALLGACGGETNDLDRYIAEVNARPAAPIRPIPPVRTYTPYKYEGLSGRDPFRTSTREGVDEFVAKTNNKGPRPDLSRTREYLERFELDTLRMVGTFSKERNDWALIRDPDGVIHRVSVGNYLGKNHGKVGRIRRNEVGLSEFINDGIGGWIIREASVALGGS